MQRFDGVLGGHSYQVLRSAALGHVELHLLASAATFHPLFDNLRFFDLVGQQYLLGNRSGFTIELLHELADDLGVGGFFSAFKDKIFAPNQFAIADEEDLHTGFAIGTGNGQHIRIALVGCDDLLLFDDAIDGIDLVAQGSSFFKEHLL